MVDDDYTVLAYNESLGKLDLWISLPDSRIEGFYADLVKLDEELSVEDKHYLRILD